MKVLLSMIQMMVCPVNTEESSAAAVLSSEGLIACICYLGWLVFPEKGSACDEALAKAIEATVYAMIPIITMVSVVVAVSLLKLVLSGELVELLKMAK